MHILKQAPVRALLSQFWSLTGMVPSLAPNVRNLTFKSLPNVLIYTFHVSDTDTVTVSLNLLLLAAFLR